MKLYKLVLLLILTMICWCSSAKSFYFKEVHADDSCFNQLLYNIEQICDKYMCDAKYHYISTVNLSEKGDVYNNTRFLPFYPSSSELCRLDGLQAPFRASGGTSNDNHVASLAAEPPTIC